MAMCNACGKEMLSATGCSAESFEGFADGLVRDRIRYGDEQRFGALETLSRPCHDCNALPGEFHHPGCDIEECPRCHAQAIGCSCCVAVVHA